MANRPQRIGVPGADRAYQNILKWLARGEWEEMFSRTIEEHVGDLCDALDVAPDDLVETLGQDAFGMVVSCAVEDMLTRRDDSGLNVVDDYLKRRGWRENGPGRRYLQALRDSVMSLYEVVEVVPGSHLVLRDMVRENMPPVRLDDRAGADAAVPWDRIAARVVEVAGQRVLGAGMLPFAFDVAEAEAARVRDTCRRGEEALRTDAREEGGTLPPREAIEAAVLAHWAPHFTRAWLADRVPAGEDAEPLVLHAVRLPLLEAGAGEVEAEVVARLDAAAALVREEDPDSGEATWNWPGPPAAGEAAPAVDDGEEPDAEEEEEEDGGGSAGVVTLGEDAVVLLTNDAERAEEGRAMLAGLLAGLVGEATVDRFPLGPLPAGGEDGDELDEDELDEIEADAPEEAAGAEEPEAPAGELDVQAALGELAAVTARIYHQLLDEPQAELDGASPREVAALGDEARRARLVTWLKRLENEDAHGARATGLPAYDFRPLWAELGLADRRH